MGKIRPRRQVRKCAPRARRILQKKVDRQRFTRPLPVPRLGNASEIRGPPEWYKRTRSSASSFQLGVLSVSRVSPTSWYPRNCTARVPKEYITTSPPTAPARIILATKDFCSHGFKALESFDPGARMGQSYSRTRAPEKIRGPGGPEHHDVFRHV